MIDKRIESTMNELINAEIWSTTYTGLYRFILKVNNSRY